MFLILLKTKTSDQFWVYPLAKMSLYFNILTQSPILNLGFFSLESSLYSAEESCNVNWFHFFCSVNCVIVFINNIV